MNINSVINAIESYAPRSFQEKWDNSGLQIALPAGQTECTGVLLCLDVNEAIIDEAERRGCNLVVSHHPLIFKGFKSLTGSTVQERAAMAAIRKGIAVYSAHTSLDSTPGGVSYAMASLLGAEVSGVIEPAEGLECILSVICPREVSEDVRLILLNHDAGAPLCAGNTGAEDTAEVVHTDCSGDILPDKLCSNPSISHVALTRVEARVPFGMVNTLMSQIKELPDASRISYSIVQSPASDAIGLGVYAILPDTGVKGSEFATRLKEAFHCEGIRVSAGYEPDMKIRRIALCGGSGGEFIGKVIRAGVDAYVTADVRYHDFADIAGAPCAVFDIGHFESESCAKSIFYSIITKKFPNFAVYYSEIEKNPVKHL